MFKELTNELLELVVVEKGFRSARFAVFQSDTGGCSCIILACCCGRRR